MAEIMMNKKVVLFADSTSDLTSELRERYNVHTCEYHININNHDYTDNVDITSDELFDIYFKTKKLPKTSCINQDDYYTAFKPYLDEGCEVVCITLGSGISNSFQNLKALSERVEGIYAVDSGNLSTATGLLVIEAAKWIEQGLSGQEVYDKVIALKPHSHASFVLDTLEFLKAGGRCSALAAFGASLFSLKVSINVDNKDASMAPGKKYRGGLSKVMPEYIKDQLTSYKNIRKDRIFFTHSGLPQELVDLGVKTIKELADPEEVCVTRASCTISSHCGPNCFGVLFIDED